MRRAGSPRHALGLTACAGLVALAVAAPAAAQEKERPLPAPVAVADDDLTEALEMGELTEAEYTLERARSVFQLALVRREFGDVERPASRDVTLILRDLALRVDELSGTDRAAARRILARPPQGGNPDIGGSDGWTTAESLLSPVCGDNVCVHWVDQMGDPDAPPLEDEEPVDGIPDWVSNLVDGTLETWEEIWAEEITTIGYRAPQPDDDSTNDGGDARLDVYLDNLGALGVFGYCTSDDPDATGAGIYAVSAYCVIDNDFAEFGGAHTPEEYQQVTSAHEFHHASQFAYDWQEDYWFMEGTATNMEETVYPDVNDNVFFLYLWSPLTRPASPLDRGGLGNSEYGSWIFWRYLQEKVAGGDPGILREIWERADAYDPSPSPADNPPDDYSLKAVTRELSERGRTFRDTFARFATANRLGNYADAQTAGYPVPPRTAAFGVGPRHRTVGWRTWRINHLASRYLSFTPGGSASKTARLLLEVRLPKYGARASVLVMKKNGSVTVRRLFQNPKGYVAWKAPFGRGSVKRVEVALTNGSTRVTGCYLYQVVPAFSCFGRPLDNNRAFRLRARLLG
jgi:hypothetical protein